jgi:uncharacterized protein involved in type VI secretion and phage assembly
VAKAQYLSVIKVKIAGTEQRDEFMGDVAEIVVDRSLHLPSMFSIRIRDHQFKWVDKAELAIGKQVEISAEVSQDRGGHSGTLIKGEITALEPYFSDQGDTTLTIRGYDKSHRLHLGKKSRVFANQTDKAIVETIAGEVGLSPDVDSASTGIQYDWVIQNNQTNMEFLLARAARIGYQVHVDDGTLYFKVGDAKLGDGPELTLSENLRYFQPCWSGTHQAEKAAVKGWDVTGKQAISQEKTAGSEGLKQGGMDKAGGDVVKAAFTGADAIVTDVLVQTVDEATAVATGLIKGISRDFVQAEGECYGDPRVKAGHTLTINKVGQRFSGEYIVTSVTHVYTAEGFKTRFSISGRQPNTLSHLLNSGNGHGRSQGLIQGVVPAMVTNVEDPDGLCRIKVKYPWIDDSIESDWIRIASPMAGPERGMLYIPEVNDEVLVGFEHGDPHRAYMMGALWNGSDKPALPTSEAVSGGVINKRIIKTRSGHVIILDDTDGAEQIIIRDKTESNEMIIDSAENSMTINVEGDFKVVAQGKITLESKEAMTLDSGDAFDVKAKKDATIAPTGNFEAKATGNSTIKGIQLALEGTAKAELKAPSVGVNGSGMTEIKGGLVKIN